MEDVLALIYLHNLVKSRMCFQLKFKIHAQNGYKPKLLQMLGTRHHVYSYPCTIKIDMQWIRSKYHLAYFVAHMDQGIELYKQKQNGGGRSITVG